jgi:fibronectin-binding autotransporter adhesin
MSLMKNRLTMLKLITLVGSTFAATAVFGQTIYTWSGTNGGDIGLAANWTPNGQPSGASQDTAQWDGIVPGDLSLVYATGWPSTGFGTSGVNIGLTSNQVGNVTITAPASGNSPAAGIFGITNNSPTAVLHLGDSSARQLSWATRPGNAGTVHGFVNNSANAAIHDSSVTWVAGGGVACVMEFGGTGDWIVNHNLRDNNAGAGPISVTLDGPGSMFWSPGGVWLASDPIGPIVINGGTMVLKGAGLCPVINPGTVPAGNNTITNLGTLKYDAAAISDNIGRVISGTGGVQVNNGTLTLSGANTYSGATLLSGGELVLGAAETPGTNGPVGLGGPISFTGGTLGFSVNNLFDYSARFSTNANQSYKLDTAGQNVILTNTLTSSGGTLTKVGSGTLTLQGTNAYTGLTTISGGKLVFQGPKTGAGSITVADSAALGITATATQITPGTLTVGTSSGATLEFNNVNSTATALMAAGTLSSAGTITINVNSGTFTVGQSYPLLTWTSGSAPTVSLGVLNGYIGTLSTAGNTLKLNITGTAYVWSGANNGNWDTNTPNNWIQNGGAATFANGGPALFDDTASGSTTVTINSVVLPASVTVNNSSKTYSIASSSGKDIGGSSSLTKSGSGTLTLSGGANAYTGATTVSGGTLSVGALANGGSASDIGAASSSAGNLVLNGGSLQYTGGAASVDRLFTLTTAGGTIEDAGTGALVFNNPAPFGYSGVGPRTLTLMGTDTDANTLAAAIANNGGATALTKNGPGLWILTGTNTYSGVTTIAAGTLQIGAGGATGSPGSGNIVDNGALDFNRTGTLTVGTISGSGSLTNDGSGTVILPGNNTYAGGTTINAGTLQIGNGGATGSVDATAPIANNGTLIFNSTADSTISGIISGTGQLIKRGSGLLKFIGANTYTGLTTIDSGAQLQLWQGNTGSTLSSAITNNGSLIMMRQDNGVAIYPGPISGTGKLLIEVSNGNGGDSTLTGTNSYTGGTYVLGGGLILGDNATPGAGSIVGNVFMTNDYIHATFATFVPAILTFNRPDAFTFPGNIVGDGQVTITGSGTATFTGANTYTNGTTISAGVLQVGNGGTTGTVGSGTVTVNSILAFNRSDNVTFSNVISGAGALENRGAGTITLTSITNYAGTITVSNGTLIINSDNIASQVSIPAGTLGGTGSFNGLFVPVTLAPGATLAPGPSVGTVGTLTINNDLYIGGNVAVGVNKSLALTNIVVSGLLTNTGTGTVTVGNQGPALAVGDKFILFSQPVTNGAAMTIVGSGVNWVNNLAKDGSISVGSFVARPTLNYAQVGGTNLQFSWTGLFKLQAQTNGPGVGIKTNVASWANYPGGSTSPVTVPIVKTNGSVFFRLAPAP